MSENLLELKHVLVAEDEPHTRFTITLILRKSGYKVSTAGDGKSAIKIIRDFKDSPQPVNLLLRIFRWRG